MKLPYQIRRKLQQGALIGNIYHGQLSDGVDISVPKPYGYDEWDKRNKDDFNDIINPSIPKGSYLSPGTLDFNTWKHFNNDDFKTEDQLKKEFENYSNNYQQKGELPSHKDRWRDAFQSLFDVGIPIASYLAQNNANNQQNNYIGRNLANPLMTLPYNDGRSDNIKYGYSQFKIGGKTNNMNQEHQILAAYLQQVEPAQRQAILRQLAQLKQSNPQKYQQTLMQLAQAMQQQQQQSQQYTPSEQDNEQGQQGYAKSGIYIKPSHKGRFTEYLKRTGNTMSEALHSPNAHVRQMANFARNSKHWKKQDGGGIPTFGQNYPTTVHLDTPFSAPNTMDVGGVYTEGYFTDETYNPVSHLMSPGKRGYYPDYNLHGQIMQQGGQPQDQQAQQQQPDNQGQQQSQQQQIMQMVVQELQQGTSPQQIVQQLVKMGVSEEQAIQIVQQVAQQLQQAQGQSSTQQMAKMGMYIGKRGRKMQTGGGMKPSYNFPSAYEFDLTHPNFTPQKEDSVLYKQYFNNALKNPSAYNSQSYIDIANNYKNGNRNEYDDMNGINASRDVYLKNLLIANAINDAKNKSKTKQFGGAYRVY